MTLLNNRYKVLQLLGSGGFGETFLAEDTHMPSGRKCVIKQLKPVTGNPNIHQLVQERFAREAAILEELGDGSKQIPRLYAYFAEDGQFYLVQEWIQGQTLSRKLQQEGLFSESSVRELLLALLPVLEYVHSQQIVHRDIKPDNIIVGCDGQPFLIDFGAVKETMVTVATASGNAKSIAIGTPGYMPSEQSAGLPVYASDLYSLGITAIYLLTGREPATLAVDPSTGRFMWQQYAGISPSFASVLEQATQPYWRDRYPNARAMLNDLLGRAEGREGEGERERGGAREDEQERTTIINTNTKYPSSPLLPLAPLSPKGTLSSPSPLLPLFLAAGLIGACVIIGFLLTKSSQPIVEITPSPSQSATTTVAASPGATPVSQPIAPLVTPSPSPRVTASTPPTPQTIDSPKERVSTSTLVAPPTPSTSTNDFSWLSEKPVTDGDLTGRSAFELDILRNSIYARKGRQFNNEKLQNYFKNQSWYRPIYSPDEFPDSLLSPLEKQNALYILAYQNRYGLKAIP